MATKANLVIDQGASFVEFIDVVDTSGNPANLYGYTVDSWFAKDFSSTTVFKFDVELVTQSKIKLYLDARVTAGIRPGRYVYDVVVKNSCDQISRVQSGIIVVTPGVTKCQQY